MSRKAIAFLSQENLLHNRAVIARHAPDAQIIAMVKANAYGHGLRSVALRLEPYVASFGVASIDEALALRAVGIRLPITLMEGVFEPDELIIAACKNFHVVFHHQTQLDWLDRYTFSQKLYAWIKVDTGMGRLGFLVQDFDAVYDRLKVHPALAHPIGLMSHFACADQLEHALNRKQIDAFAKLAARVNGPKSLCNSAAFFSFKEQQYNVIRPGIALYGVSPFKDISADALGLRPVMTLQSRLIAIKNVRKNSSIGYGATFTCPEDMPVGIIALGYGDGYPRSAPHGIPVLINGVRCQLIGRVSMDMMAVDLRACAQVVVGSSVTLWGEGLPIEEIAVATGLSAYELLTALQLRVTCRWSS